MELTQNQRWELCNHRSDLDKYRGRAKYAKKKGDKKKEAAAKLLVRKQIKLIADLKAQYARQEALN